MVDDGLSVTGVWAFVRPFLSSIIAAAVVSAGLGFAVSYAFPKTYESATLLVPVVEQGAGGGMRSLASRYGAIASLVGIDVGGGDFSTASLLATVRSRGFIEEFISAESLMDDLFPDKWDAGAGRWKDPSKAPTPGDAFDLFSKKVLTVVEDKKTGLVTIRVTWRDGATAARWANAIVTRANSETRATAIADADKSIAFLQKEAASVDTVDLRQSVYSLLESQMNRRMMAVTRPDFAFRVIDIARPPDPRRPISPRRFRFAALGGVIGLLGALVAAGVAGVRRRPTAVAR